MIAIIRREIKTILSDHYFGLVFCWSFMEFLAIQVLICIHVILQKGRKSPMISQLFLMRVKCMKGIYRRSEETPGIMA